MQTRKRGVSALYVIGAALLSCAHITGVGAPFGVAFAAAACRAGYGFGAVLGTFAGYLLSMQGAEGVPYAGAALMTLAAATIFFGTRLLSARWFFPVMAAVSVAATGAVFAFADGVEWHKALLFACRVVLAGGTAYFYEAALDTTRGRPQVVRFGGMLILAATLLMAAYPFTVADLVCPARIAGIFVVMAIGYMGGFSYGAASGVGIGVAMDAAGGVGLYYAGVYAARVSRLANHYASVASDAFSEMYQAMANSGKARKEENDLGAVFDRTADRVCRRCSARENCWERDKLATLRTLDSISGPLLRTGHISSGDFPGHFAAQCLRFSDFVLALNEGMDALFQRRQTQKKNEAGRKLIAQQYAGVTGILKQVGESMRSGTEILPAQEKELRTYAEAFGRVRTVAAWKDRRGRLHLELTGECVQRILRSQEGFMSGLGALMHVTLTKPETQYDSGGMRLMFREQEPYYITVGIGTRTREGQQISGDCVRYFTTEEGIACVILSDGMGSGEQAREESESTVRMAERFLRAGISAADCVRTIGPALKLRTQGKKFVTLDISTIDLFTGEAVSVKCGAAPSFVRAADGDDSVRVRRILSSTLPAGLEEAGDMDVTQFQMGSQDALVLLSDGIVDADGSNAGWVEELLADSVKLSARELAARLVLEGSARGAPDDMSAVVVYLGKRAQREMQEAGG